ncbi:MAG: putative manganese-dependent inorganic diphosphatase [Spirochaetaceae bacterium]|nr:putative manganese-dependent inorganic diphosphatase [Spirochaetaceae bacterium]
MKKNTKTKTYIIGHKNPDTDSIVSAAAYAVFKQNQGYSDYIACRAGKPTPQTEYIFSRFQVPLPQLVSDLIPRIKHFCNDTPITIHKDTCIWDAFTLMQKHGLRFLPVVDSDGTYHSGMHFALFTEMFLKRTKPQQRTVIETSIRFLADVIGAKKILGFDETGIKTSPVIIGAASIETFRQYIEGTSMQDTIVICGNRRDIQELAVKHGARLLIVTTGNEPDTAILELARKNSVSILLSPYDTTSTAQLLIYAMPVSAFSSTDIEPVLASEPLHNAKNALERSPARTLAVIDGERKVVGTISQSDAYGKPNINVILVDHNEISQSVDGMQHFDIVEVIDHHRLGNVPTQVPITFINQPVGATCTIVTNLFFSQSVDLPKDIASILLCGILADTLLLQSATTTDIDRQTAHRLATITKLDIQELGKQLIKAASNISGRSAEDLVNQDLKEYSEDSYSYTVSQIEVEDLSEIIERKNEIIEVLEQKRKTSNKLFSALMITDITRLTSILLIAAVQDFKNELKLPQEQGIFQLSGIVSRKKQLLPLLSELIKHYAPL